MNRNVVGNIYRRYSICPDPLTNMAAIGNSCFWLVDFSKTLLWNCLAKWTEIWWGAPMEGSLLSFLKAEWKVSDTGSALRASSLLRFHHKKFLKTFNHYFLHSHKNIYVIILSGIYFLLKMIIVYLFRIIL